MDEALERAGGPTPPRPEDAPPRPDAMRAEEGATAGACGDPVRAEEDAEDDTTAAMCGEVPLLPPRTMPLLPLPPPMAVPSTHAASRNAGDTTAAVPLMPPPAARPLLPVLLGRGCGAMAVAAGWKAVLQLSSSRCAAAAVAAAASLMRLT